MNILIRWLISTLVIIAVAYILPGVSVAGFLPALVAALVLGLLNTFLKPLLFILTLPVTVLTLGIFYFVLNAIIALIASAVVPGFEVANFWWALLFSLLIGAANLFLAELAKD